MFEPEAEPLGKRLERLRPYYIGVFLAQVVAAGAVITWREVAIGGHATPADAFIAVTMKMDDVCYLAIITSVLIVDFGRSIVGLLIKAPQDRAREQGMAIGLAEGMEKGMDIGHAKGVEEGHAKGREEGMAIGRAAGLVEGRAEARSESVRAGIAEGAAAERQRWLEYDRDMHIWYQKYRDARERGEDFDELPPKAP